MSDRAGPIAAILNDPADDTPRLVFADLLEENGELARVGGELGWDRAGVACKS